MIDLLRRNPLIAALGVLCVLLAIVIAIELATVGRGGVAAPPAKLVAAEAKLLPPIAALAPEVAYPETAARPLWIPTRRPAPPPAVQQASFRRGQFTLAGVTIAGGTRIAMLKDTTSGRIHRVEQGKEVNGLQVAEIQPESVTLAQGGEREVVELRVQRPGGPTAPGAAPPPTAASAAGPFAGATSAGAAPIVPAPPGVPPNLPRGPMPATRAGGLGLNTPVTANPSPGAVPQNQSAPMTPEELLARRRARRNPSPE